MSSVSADFYLFQYTLCATTYINNVIKKCHFWYIFSILFQKRKTGAQLVRRKKEKSAAILVTIIVVFFLCHVHRLSVRVYEMASPESSIYEHYIHCDKKGLYHVPVVNYFLTHMHYLFLAINSSVNFIIYCAMGQQFRRQLCKMWKAYLFKLKTKYGFGVQNTF